MHAGALWVGRWSGSSRVFPGLPLWCSPWWDTSSCGPSVLVGELSVLAGDTLPYQHRGARGGGLRLGGYARLTLVG